MIRRFIMTEPAGVFEPVPIRHVQRICLRSLATTEGKPLNHANLILRLYEANLDLVRFVFLHTKFLPRFQKIPKGRLAGVLLKVRRPPRGYNGDLWSGL
jgi:hypothetical protein